MSTFRKKRILSGVLALSMLVSASTFSACDALAALFPNNDSASNGSTNSEDSSPFDTTDSDTVNISDSSDDESGSGNGNGSNDESSNGNGGNGDDPTPDVPHECTYDPYVGMTATEFYQDYTVACCSQNAAYRTKHGFLSGELTVPDQAPTLSTTRPKNGNFYVRNSEMLLSADGNTYTVVDVYGNAAFNVYRDGAYITLEEVAAYVYAFGTYPKNHSTSKKTKPTESTWGEYLRVNHTKFSGNTSNYPYEPELPNITGCGGSLQYYEMDIGTTGTTCDPNYSAALYNNGTKITRGAARIVYGKNDLNRNGKYEIGEFHVFYTYNHYNDFQEYLNYQGGWGEMFGNITGGGSISSEYDYAPTPYVPVVLQPLK